MSFEQILSSIAAYDPNADLDVVRRAYDFAAKAHEGDLLSRWSYDEGALLKLQLQKFIAATNPGLTDLWHEA
mgnify:CR=1 FL=1